jgi:hypothetical protein
MIECDQVGATLTFTANSTTIGAYLLSANPSSPATFV